MSDETQSKMPEPGEQLPPKSLDMDAIEDGVRRLLEGLGQSSKTEVMQNSPRRIAELYAEVINAPWCDIEIPWKCFPNPGVHDLIIVTDCHYVSMCEHHLAPALGVAHFAYVPDERITGYSKVKKALNYLARQPQLNERLLKDALDACEAVLQPKGVGLVLHSVHMCLACKANAPSQEIVTVQDFRGVLKEDPYRRDFLATAYGKRPVMGAGW
ncbi:MAG: GTP cyclohydrolase I [Myxococcales bacterium]|nr:GTP cyclohydrolase I [Myxococcales bacterium]